MNLKPGEIEQTSLQIIREELEAGGIRLPEENAGVILRCIHASADFDYAETLRFTPGAVPLAINALRRGVAVVTDTNMAKAGISRPALRKLGGEVFCYMAEDEVAREAKARGVTRAAVSMEHAAGEHPRAVFAIGNAPTALFTLAEAIERGLRPALIIAVPVGFVHVEESKTRILAACGEAEVPCIAAMGRKGGSSIAAAVCNCLLYAAAGMEDPAARGWG
ncbi:MAG: precorrin-8X methylmutase [Oscillospiraceae bacterium]|nr:precorrin-8X methylmutase [Oscillospiraceae bacterium]